MSSAKVEIYYSSVSGNRTAQSEQSSIELIFKNNKIPYVLVDVSSSSEAESRLRKNGTFGRYPQVFVNDKFKAFANDIMDANEYKEVDKLLFSEK